MKLFMAQCRASIANNADGTTKELGVFLMPAEYNTGYTSASYTMSDLEFYSNALYRYTAEDINVIGRKFGKLRNVVRSHAQDCRSGPDGKIPLIERLIND